ARSARPPADAYGARPPAHAAQKSYSRHLGQVRPPPSGGKRSLRRTSPRPAPPASRAPAALYGVRYSAASRAGRDSGPSGARVRTPGADRVQAHAHHSGAPALTGVGLMLAIVIALEIGSVARFRDPNAAAVSSTGDKRGYPMSSRKLDL